MDKLPPPLPPLSSVLCPLSFVNSPLSTDKNPKPLLVAHWVGSDYRAVDYYNPVDGDEVPVPHTGLALGEAEFHTLAGRVRAAGVHFVIEPHLRFEGMPGEQWTMFFKDPSGNNLEFKSMRHSENLFAKYNVE